MLSNLTRRVLFSTTPKGLSFANMCPQKLSGKNRHQIQNLVNGQWKVTEESEEVVDPLDKSEQFILSPLTSVEETKAFQDSMLACPLSGLHNPLKNVNRYIDYGKVILQVTQRMHEEQVLEFFIKLVQRVAPKSYLQARAEVVVTRNFLENYNGDNARFLLKGFSVAGDHQGQQSNGYRFPFGPVSIIAPFNFPLEIPVLQLIGALLSGNKVCLKGDNRVSVVMEQFLRLMIECGMPAEDVDFLNCTGPVMEHLIKQDVFKMTQFTGSSRVAEQLAISTRGKIKIEDAGFNWKLLGPDTYTQEYQDYVAHMSDHDAYAYSGQKCSAQSILFIHDNWMSTGFLDRIKVLAEQRNLTDLTIGPVLSWDNTKIQSHVDSVLAIPGSYLLFGGQPLSNDHSIPSQYGSYQPTAVFVPFQQLDNYWSLVTTELFGPFQIVTNYSQEQLPSVKDKLTKMANFLTCAVVSNDPLFQQDILANTINGTTYTGIKARTTGAPQNHWFGPGGDPRGAGIGSKEAILLCWSYHREIVQDQGPINQDFVMPKQQ